MNIKLSLCYEPSSMFYLINVIISHICDALKVMISRRRDVITIQTGFGVISGWVGVE